MALVRFICRCETQSARQGDCNCCYCNGVSHVKSPSSVGYSLLLNKVLSPTLGSLGLSHLPLDICFMHTTIINKQGKRKRSEEHTSELQSLMRISYAVYCLKKKK